MVTKVAFTVHAERVLTEIVEYIAHDDERAAFRLVVELRKRVVGTLSVFPAAGTKWGERKRSLTIRGYAFVYRFDPVTEEVMVLDVFGPGMDWR